MSKADINIECTCDNCLFKEHDGIHCMMDDSVITDNDKCDYWELGEG